MFFHCNNGYVNVPNITLYTQCLFCLAVDPGLAVDEPSFSPSFTRDYMPLYIVKVMLSSCLIAHHAMKACGG
jgi:hypothetical protein